MKRRAAVAGKLWFALVALVLIGLAWRVMTLGLADHWARSDPERALRWRSGHPLALRVAAENLAKSNREPALAEHHALAALAANPLEGRPYRVLAQLAEHSGASERALRLYQIAAQRAPRDLLTRAWLADHYLSRGKPTEALAQIDQILRVQPKAWSALKPGLLTLAKTPAVQPALADLLTRDPPWRATFLSQLARDTDALVAVDPLWQELRKRPGGIPLIELNPWIARLLREGEGGAAYLVWVSQLAPRELNELGNLFNGGFELAPTGLGFDWSLGRVAGARIDRVVASGATGSRALRVAFDDRRVPFAHVQQFLSLPDGAWLLAGRARADGLRTERGLVWQISCYPSGAVLARSEPLLGQRPWHAFSAEFQVPAEDCPSQTLRLLLPARIPAEQRIGGQAWFDDLRVGRALFGEPG